MRDEESSHTKDLMESYGIESIDAFSSKPLTVDTIREAIETGRFPSLEDDATTTPTKAQRDDLALKRWREMAGLGPEGEPQ